MILGIFFLLLHPLTISSSKLKFFLMTFFMVSLALILRRLTVRMESLLIFSKTVLPSSLTAWSNSFVCVSLLLPILLAESLLTFNPSNYRPIALISCLPKAFESVLNKKIMRHLSAHNLLSERPVYWLNLGHPLLRTSLKNLLSALTYWKRSI